MDLGPRCPLNNFRMRRDVRILPPAPALTTEPAYAPCLPLPMHFISSPCTNASESGDELDVLFAPLVGVVAEARRGDSVFFALLYIVRLAHLRRGLQTTLISSRLPRCHRTRAALRAHGPPSRKAHCRHGDTAAPNCNPTQPLLAARCAVRGGYNELPAQVQQTPCPRRCYVGAVCGDRLGEARVRLGRLHGRYRLWHVLLLLQPQPPRSLFAGCAIKKHGNNAHAACDAQNAELQKNATPPNRAR